MLANVTFTLFNLQEKEGVAIVRNSILFCWLPHDMTAVWSHIWLQARSQRADPDLYSVKCTFVWQAWMYQYLLMYKVFIALNDLNLLKQFSPRMKNVLVKKKKTKV